jgi:uncharacterized coiled-coil DUF342 family protein
MTIQQELAELEKKANKYDSMRERMDEWHNKVMGLIKAIESLLESLKSLSYDIKPSTTVKITIQKSSGVQWKVIVAEWYEKMQAGQEVTRDFIRKIYPEWSYNSVGTLFAQLGKCKGVEKAKIGKGKKLYIRKEFR